MIIDEEDEQYSQQFSRQSTNLYSKAVKKREKIHSYAKSDRQFINRQKNINLLIQKQALEHLQTKIRNEREENQHKDIQIGQLKEMIRYLMYQRDSLLNQFQIFHIQTSQINNNTQKTLTSNRLLLQHQTKNKQNKKIIKDTNISSYSQNLQSLSKEQIVQLLRKTQQYQQFINYYENHQIKFLQIYKENNRKHTLQKNNPKNNYSSQQIMMKFQDLIKEQNLPMNNYHQDVLMNKFKDYYQNIWQKKQKELIHAYIKRINKYILENQLKMQEINENSKLKQAELINNFRRKRTK